MSPVGSIENLRVYVAAMDVGTRVWTLMQTVDGYDAKSLATQLIRSTDSIAANLAEGFGRFTFAERIRYCHIARGSLQESLCWLAKAKNREIVSRDNYVQLESDFLTVQKMLNGYLRSLRQKR